MLSSINKHTQYMTSTLGYISDQIKAHPEILRSAQVFCVPLHISVLVAHRATIATREAVLRQLRVRCPPLILRI